MGDNTAGATLESIDIMRLMKLLPHRYPFLLVDRIIDIKGDESCVGIKNITINPTSTIMVFCGSIPRLINSAGGTSPSIRRY